MFERFDEAGVVVEGSDFVEVEVFRVSGVVGVAVDGVHEVAQGFALRSDGEGSLVCAYGVVFDADD